MPYVVPFTQDWYYQIRIKAKLDIMYSLELIRQLQSHYLQDEERYDKWGAQGKVLLVQEVLHIDSGVALEPLINAAFPRTFSCQRNNQPLSSDPIHEYHTWVKNQLRGYLESTAAEIVALEETAEKFCAPVSDIRDLIAE
jgi:hypothetical protein